MSCEPLLSAIDLGSIPLWANDRPDFKSINALNGNVVVDGYDKSMVLGRYSKLDWVIVGAESGPGARPMDEAWVCTIKKQCVASGIPFFYKQKVVNGKKISTPLLDGKQWTDLPNLRTVV